jgi:hypothetical protein
MPRVKMTRTTKLALYSLRIYLLVLFVLLVVRFVLYR